MSLVFCSQKYYNTIMKLCKYCNKYYPESEFGVALSTENKIYRRLKCKICYNNTKKILRDSQQKWLDDYKKDHKCFKCGLNDYRVLEFHHIGDKEFTIAYAFFNHYGIERIKKEVEKCKVVCANCHRLIHYRKNNYKKDQCRGIV